jgi:hypothetical protein
MAKCREITENLSHGRSCVLLPLTKTFYVTAQASRSVTRVDIYSGRSTRVPFVLLRIYIHTETRKPRPQCIYMFRLILTINSDYFPKQH